MSKKMPRFLHIAPVFVPYLLNFGELFPKCLAISKKCPTFALANKKHRGVEQLVARQAHNLEVARSSRTPATNEARSEISPTLLCMVRSGYPENTHKKLLLSAKHEKSV